MKSCFTYFLDIFIKAAEGFFKYFNRLLETLRGLGKFKKVIQTRDTVESLHNFLLMHFMSW